MDLTIYAFPRKDDHYLNSGMTLRDYFAAKAMQSFIVTNTQARRPIIASMAYQMADEMMEERDAHQDGTR
jgi:hypothetical protein